MKNFNIELDEFARLSLTQKLTIFKNYIWWAARIQLTMALGAFSPLFSFYYFTFQCPDQTFQDFSFCLSLFMIGINAIFFLIWISFRPYWVEKYSKELTKWWVAEFEGLED